MSLKQTIDADLKQALLSGDKDKANAFRSLKAAILDVEVSSGAREKGLPDAEIEKIIQKEIKKRKESIAIYTENSRPELAAAEQQEVDLFSKYLPEQLTPDAIKQIVDTVTADFPDATIKDMGKVIGAVKAKAGSSADGAIIAQLVKEKLSSK